MGDSAIETSGLTRDFGKLRALDALSMRVPSGAIFGFLGPNGAGKTTTIRLLLGLLEPSIGDAKVLGFDTVKQGDRVREQVGVLLDNDGLYLRLSAWDNLDFFGQVYRMPTAVRRARAEELLRHFDLWERRQSRVADFSRGMRQKLAVARAMLPRPRLIFLDEPTSGLDAVSAVAFREDIHNLANREGVTVFLTTHNLAEAEKVCDLVGIVRQGRLLAFGSINDLRARASGRSLEVVGTGIPAGTVDQLRAHPSVASVEVNETGLFLDLRGTPSAAPLVRLLVQAGAEIEEVKRVEASLEEAFLTLVKEEEG